MNPPTITFASTLDRMSRSTGLLKLVLPPRDKRLDRSPPFPKLETDPTKWATRKPLPACMSIPDQAISCDPCVPNDQSNVKALFSNQ